jgi:hypothetical protein
VLPEEVRLAIIETNAAVSEALYAPTEPDPNEGRDLPPKWQ